MPANDSGVDLTEKEKQALSELREKEAVSRDELESELGMSGPEVSDLLLSLRYKGKASFDFDAGVFRYEG